MRDAQGGSYLADEPAGQQDVAGGEVSVDTAVGREVCHPAGNLAAEPVFDVGGERIAVGCALSEGALKGAVLAVRDDQNGLKIPPEEEKGNHTVTG